eukprot:scaffold7363_cov263-Pinguiococcus_pyrenoidosus.AAC.8
MVDVCVFADYFHQRGVSSDDVAVALAYLFKVPEGAAVNTDPGFFHQMRKLEHVLERSSGKRSINGVSDVPESLEWAEREGIISADQRRKILAHAQSKRQRTS